MPSATTSAIPSRSPPKTKPYPKARQAKRLDIKLYLPLGSIALGSFYASFAQQGSWNELEATEVASPDLPWTSDLALLIHNAWCRVFAKCSEQGASVTLRVYALPDDVGRGDVSRNNGRGRSCLRTILALIDCTSAGWNGEKLETDLVTGYLPEYIEDDSLFYMFNTLPSPEPDPDLVQEPFAAQAMQDVIDTGLLSQGLNTELYHYQRRSAAAMIQKETQPQMKFDPRLERLVGPDGNAFYLDRSACRIYLSGKWYHEIRGGILAETMGYGKTLICFAVILATKSHLPEVPPDEVNDVQSQGITTGCRSLALQAATVAARYNVQWKLWFEAQHSAGMHYDRCYDLLQANASTYTVQIEKGRSRNPVVIKHKYHLSSTTLVVVPANLLQQWQWQLQEHVQPGALSALIVDDRSVSIPDPDKIHLYDLIILSGERFEEEIYPLRGNHTDVDSIKVCCCFNLNQRRLCQEHPYKSPLLDVHFLRFIVDEGVRFMSESKTQAIYALQSIRVDRKWIVSGTPARSLIGAEVELATEQNAQESDNSQTPELVSIPSDDTGHNNGNGLSRVQSTLTGRKKATDLEDESRTIARLGTIIRSFFGLQPWASPDSNDGAYWNTYFLPNKSGTRKLLSLKNVLKDVVIRHRFDDLMTDLQLPSLENKYVYLEPSFIDKLSMNLFLVMLTANAVTSERKDQDYMFHPRNRKALELLVRNLRHSAFFWCGISPSELEKTCEVSRKYLDKPEAPVTEEDRQLLEHAIIVAQTALNSSAWQSFSKTGEIGLFVEDFPLGTADMWALCKNDEAHRSPLLMSATGLRIAQRKVEDSLYTSAPLSTLLTGPPLPDPKHSTERIKGSQKGKGRTASEPKSSDEAIEKPQKDKNGDSSKPGTPIPLVEEPHTKDSTANGTPSTQSTPTPSTIPTSALQESRKTISPQRTGNERKLKNAKPESRPSIVPKSALQEPRKSINSHHAGNESKPSTSHKFLIKNTEYEGEGADHKSILKTTIRKPEVPPTYQSLSRPRLIGTPSAKLSYLLDRITELYRSEKILVFYEGDDIAYYCAQALEILDIPHRIYASGIKKQLRNQYQNEFNHDESIRVMLVDLNQAALGLHLASASRVFFINPVWQPGLEAQAIKRAHRIGSKRDIKTETLVLRGTLEEDLLHRRESMNAEEHRKASRSLLDDAPMKRILQSARLYHLPEDQIRNEQAQIARLATPQQVFAHSIASAYDGDAETLSTLMSKASRDAAEAQTLPKPVLRGDADPATNSVEPEASRGLKRKLVFVDELEQRSTAKSRKLSAHLSDMPSEFAEIRGDHPRRRTMFADEKGMALHSVHHFGLVEDGDEPTEERLDADWVVVTP